MKNRLIIIVITIISLFLNCGKKKDTYTIEIKDGVRHIHNHAPLWGDTLKVALEFVQKIGDLEAEDENYLLHRVSGVTVDSGGNIYVIDSGNYRIQKYDSNGKYLATFGRKGQGPGEFLSPQSIGVDSTGNIYVYDKGNNRISVLSKEGRALRTFKFGRNAAEFRLLQSGEFITNTLSRIFSKNLDAVSNPTAKYTIPVVQIYDKEGKLLREFGKPYDYKDNVVNPEGNVFFYSSDKNNFIYLSFKYQNRIEKYSSEGRLLFTAERPLSYKISRPKTKVKAYPGEVVGIPLPIFNIVSWGIGSDYKERIWVLTVIEQPGKDKPGFGLELEIYNNKGILLGEIPWGEENTFSYRNFYMIGERVFFIDFKRITVYEYKIVEK